MLHICSSWISHVENPPQNLTVLGMNASEGSSRAETRWVVRVHFSNRCFPTKAMRGWLSTDDQGHLAIVSTYFNGTEGFAEPLAQLRNPGAPGNPLFAVWDQLGVRDR